MHDFYYSKTPQSAHQYGFAAYEYRGAALRFTTDAGVFSRGEVDHGTDTLLRSLPESMEGRVLDLGCGWGVVGVSVGKRYPGCEIVMTDINERAKELSERNARANGVNALVLQGDGLESVDGAFDYILTNPPIRAGKQVIYRLFRESAARLTPEGFLYLVIRKQQGAESALKYLKTIFSLVETVEKSGGFWVIRCQGGMFSDV
ncbi:MAG: class I SAM-dependent methyltransferase [Clostridia bacterium]|nr:class I SAM-dependent methyltransferase [Clostridia bacterium]